MFCIKCGVRLADTEKKCPLCGTVVYHPDLQQEDVRPLYPKGRHPKIQPNSKTLNGFFIILFLIPIILCLFSDLQADGKLDWFGFAAGGLLIGYISVGLPFWFRKPNPVIFLPCDFAAIALFLFYINLVTNGDWFLSFALPITGAVGIIVCTVVTLLRYLRRGKLYIFGGAFIGFGLFLLLIEFLLNVTFDIDFVGWSIYPLVVFVLLGVGLIYLAINRTAREMMERKLFF